ncbi:MAG: hypothetical protein WBD40_14690 [Tepidisphaeraceae bacterium]
MHLRDLKRWHWVAIAIPIGLALSFAWTSLEPTVPRHLGQETFERDLVAAPIEGHPWLDNLVVHPQREGVMVVTGEQLALRANERVADYRAFAFNAITPYQPLPPRGRNAPPADPNETIVTYLEKVAQQHSHVRFRYAWQEHPAIVYAIWTGGAMILIGGVWPTLLGLLIGAGFGGGDEADDDYDLSRFGKDADAQAASAAQVGLDAAHLAEVEAELQHNLEGIASPGGTTSTATPPQVKKLEGGPVESAPLPDDDPNREYKGEFYPVAKPHGKPKA